MGVQKTKRRANHKWDMYQRTVVYVLHTNFVNLDRISRTKIFNAYFKAQLDENKQALSAQYGERDRKPQIWANIRTAPSSSEQWQKRLKLVRDIQRVAVALGLDGRAKIPVAAGVVSKRDATHLSHTKLSERPAGVVTVEERLTRAKPVKRVATASSVQIAIPSPRMKPINTDTTPTASTTPCVPVQRRPNATILHTLSSGHSMWLTPDEFKNTQEHYVPVPDALAHPPLPPLLFRYWSSLSQSRLTEGEFRARSFPSDDIAIPPMPDLDDIRLFPWNRIFYHLNRDHCDSPFISTSNYFLWVLRLAAKERTRGVNDGAITLIDTSKLERTKAYHVQPFHRELLKTRAFQNGAHRYHGSHEFLIYHKIPKEAVICTLQLSELCDLADRIPAMHDILRFQILEAKGDYRAKLRSKLEGDNIQLSPGIVTALARIVNLCLNHQSPVEQIANLVAEIVFGWAFSLQPAMPQEWVTSAGVFSYILCRGTNPPSGVAEEQRMKLAFLEGVKWACGSYNTRHTPKQVLKMREKAESIGLGCPAKLLSDELATIELDLWSFERREQEEIQFLTTTRAAFLSRANFTTSNPSRKSRQSDKSSCAAFIDDEMRESSVSGTEDNEAD